MHFQSDTDRQGVLPVTVTVFASALLIPLTYTYFRFYPTPKLLTVSSDMD